VLIVVVHEALCLPFRGKLPRSGPRAEALVGSFDGSSDVVIVGGVTWSVTEPSLRRRREQLQWRLNSDMPRHDRIDEYVLIIHPRVLGTGCRRFPGGSVPALSN